MQETERLQYVSHEVKHIVTDIEKWFRKNGPDATAVIGISGGKDSTVAAALLAKALGPERVLGVLMPDGNQADFEDAKKVVEILEIHSLLLNIEPITEACRDVAARTENPLNSQRIGLTLSSDAEINMPPRVRMTMLYAVAQSLPQGGRVINTCNRSEEFIGWSTKYGDSAGDFAPLQQYTVEEILTFGDFLGLPHDLVHKAPADGLCGSTDEDKFGFTYRVLDRYLLTGKCKDEEALKKIRKMHQASAHKRKSIPSCRPLLYACERASLLFNEEEIK